MRLKGDQNTTRALNRRLVLDCLRREGEVSRIDLVGRTGLSAAAISGVVGELQKEGFVSEGPAGKSSGGRRPILLHINYDRRCAIGFKLILRRLEATLTDLATRPISSLVVELAEQTPTEAAAAAVEAVERLLPNPVERREKLVGVGLAMPGLIDTERGVCLSSHRFGWGEVPIGRLIADRVEIPVWVDNDVNAFAIAQQLFGHGRQKRSVMVLIIGTGVGAALVFDGQIHRGGRYAAGEIGFVRDEANGGNSTWDQRFSEPALVAKWSQLQAERNSTSIDLEEAARIQDPDARRLLEETGRSIGQRLAAMIDLVDPEIVIVGGEAMRFGSFLTDSIRRAAAEFSFIAPPPIEIDWDNNVWSRGASALAIQHFFDFEAAAGLQATKHR